LSLTPTNKTGRHRHRERRRSVQVMFVGSGRPLEDAARVAFKAMVRWVRERTGMAELDAYQFVSQVARAPIVQLVDPEYTVLVKIEKGRLPRP